MVDLFKPERMAPPAPIMTMDIAEENFNFTQICPGLPESVRAEIYTQILLAIKGDQIEFLKDLTAMPNLAMPGFEPVRVALNDPVQGQARANALVQVTRQVGLLLFFKIHELGWFLDGEFPYFPMRITGDRIFLRPDNPAIDAFRATGWPVRR